MGEDRRRSVKNSFHWLGEGDGANRFHLRLLQPAPNGDTFRLAIVFGVGRIPPADRRKAIRNPEWGPDTG